MKKTFIIVVILAIFTKILGFFREILLANYFGTSQITDAFNLTSVLPILLFGSLGSALASAYIPVSASLTDQKEKTTLLIQISCFYFLISLLGLTVSLTSSELIVHLIAPGSHGQVFEIIHFFTKIALLSIPFVGLTNILVGYQQANNKHYGANAIAIPWSGAAIILIILAHYYDERILAYATPAAYFAQTIFLLFLINSHFKFLPSKKDLFDFSGIQSILSSTFIILPTLLMIQSNSLIDRIIATNLEEGSISALAYSDRIITLFIGIFILGLSSIIFPKLASDHKENNHESFSSNIRKSIQVTMIAAIPVSIGLIFFHREVIYLVYFRGAFDLNSLDLTSSCLLFYSLGLIFIGPREIITKSFYAKKSSFSPLIAAAITILSNTALSLYFSKFLGVKGIALATSISLGISLLYLIFGLRKNIGNFSFVQGAGKTFIIVTILSTIPAFIIHWLMNEYSDTYPKTIIYVFGAAIYFALSYAPIYYLVRKKKLTVE